MDYQADLLSISVPSTSLTNHTLYSLFPSNPRILPKPFFTSNINANSTISVDGNWIIISTETIGGFQFRAKNDTNIILTQSFTLPPGPSGPSIVNSVSLSGSTAAIGSNSSTSCSPLSNLGAVYIYKLSGTAWSYSATICPLTNSANYNFGKQVELILR